MRSLAGWLGDRVDLWASRSIDVDDCRSVCLMLGPYRNLTTLTASLVFLHPHCQVLNHAGDRVFGRRSLDFLSDYRRDRLDNFIRYAIRISAKGRRGDYGGSITHSHAFDEKHAMRDAFESAGGELLKEEVRCLFWKESQRTANLLRSKNVDLGAILEREPRLRFLMPVRHPLDCAVSNRKTGHVQLLPGLPPDPSTADVAFAILDEIRWFADLEARHPGRFFRFFQHELSRATLERLAAFLEIEPFPSRWLDAAERAIDLKKGYEHDAGLVEAYREGVAERFEGHPELAAGLLYFVDG